MGEKDEERRGGIEWTKEGGERVKRRELEENDDKERLRVEVLCVFIFYSKITLLIENFIFFFFFFFFFLLKFRIFNYDR